MISDYQDLFVVVNAALPKMGFVLYEDEDFCARFKNDNDSWEVIFTGDRYMRPALDLSIGMKIKTIKWDWGKEYIYKETYPVWMLMEIFSEIEEIPETVPSLVNQLEFLWLYKDKLFIDPQPYAEMFDEKNKIPERLLYKEKNQE